MIIELHVLQNFAPSNLNRDDTNSPKDCEFGGYRRARISSQCIKRSIRSEFSRSQLLPEELLSTRTKNLVEALIGRLTREDRHEETVRQVAEFAVEGAGLALKEGKTQYLLFLGVNAITQFAELIDQNWDELAAAIPSEENEKKAGKKGKKAAKAEAPPALKAAITTLLNGTRAADLALFGRMLADRPGDNIDAACQVAHALSTNKVEMEFDFYTAVDDLNTSDETGAGMMGTVEFNSSCFYRYANIDVAQLTANLGGDDELVAQTIEAFVKAAVLAIPTGKQNSMAAHNPPSFVLAVVRDAGHWSLANAFLKPVRPTRDEDLIAGSIRGLTNYWQQLVDCYGPQGIRHTAVLSLDDSLLADHSLAKAAVESNGEGKLNALIGQIRSTLQQEAK